MKIMMIGDISGRPGRQAVQVLLPEMVEKYKIDCVIANGENAAGGTGITQPIAQELFGYGIHCLTMGNHIWDKREIFTFIDNEPRIVRPANYPPGTPGQGSIIFYANNTAIGVISLSGRVYMPAVDCPFRIADREVERLKAETSIIIVDFHAEATSEKMALAWYLDGRVSAVVGTHTHVQTADERILPQGTAYISDVGMTGPRDSVLGVDKELVIRKFITGLPVRFELAKGPALFSAVIIEIDAFSGKALAVTRVQKIFSP